MAVYPTLNGEEREMVVKRLEPEPERPDPTMPRVMPESVKRELQGVLAWRVRPNPIDFYMVIRDALMEAQKDAGT